MDETQRNNKTKNFRLNQGDLDRIEKIRQAHPFLASETAAVRYALVVAADRSERAA